MKSDPRVDAYISKAPEFAQPILKETRKRLNQACPSAVETIKWNVPFFVLDDKLLASMAAFKKHVKVGVWSGMKPAFVDVTSVAELPGATAFKQQLQAAVSIITGKQPASAAAKSATKKSSPRSAKKSSALPSKKASVKKSAKKTTVNKAKKTR